MGMKATMGAPKTPRAINGPDMEPVNQFANQSRNVPC